MIKFDSFYIDFGYAWTEVILLPDGRSLGVWDIIKERYNATLQERRAMRKQLCRWARKTQAGHKNAESYGTETEKPTET